MSNTSPTSPKPSTASTQNSPSGWTTAQPATKRDRPNYASPTASSSATTGRAKSRTLDGTTKASLTSTTSPGTTSATKEKKVSLRRNTEKSLSPTPATSQAWVSAKKGAKATTPPPATTTTALRRGRGSASQDESSLSARIDASSTMNELKKTGTTTEALDLLDPNMTRARSSSRMKRSVSDADLAFEAALEIRDQIKSGTPPPQIEEEELSEEEEHQEEETEESQSPPQEQVEPTHTETQNETQPSKPEEQPARAVPHILVSQAKEPEPEEAKPEEPVHHQIQESTPPVQESTPQAQSRAPETQEVKPEEPVHQQIQEATPPTQESVPQVQEVAPQEQPTVQIQQPPQEAENPTSPQAEPQQSVEHHEPSKQDITHLPEQHKEPSQPEPVIHVEAKEDPQAGPIQTATSQETKEQPAVQQPTHEPLQQQSEETKPPQEPQTSQAPQEPASVQVVEAPAPVQQEVKEVKEPEVASSNAAPVAQPIEQIKHEVLKNSTDSQESDPLQFSMEPQKESSKEQRPSSPAPTESTSTPTTTTPTRQEEPKSIIDVIEQQELKRRQDEENRRKALLEQEDKIKRSVQDKIQKALEERRKQVLSPNSEDGRRKSFDTTDLSTSAPMSPAPMIKPPSEGSLPIYISPTRQQNNPNSILSASAPGPPSILSSSPGNGSKRDFKRVSFNFEDGRILYPGTDGHLDLVTHAPKRKDEEKEKENEKSGSPEKSAPTVSVTAPVEKTEKPASPVITSTGFVPATTSPQSKEEAKQAALAEKRKSINDRIQMMLNVDSGQQRRRSFDERDAEELKTIREQQDQRAKQEEAQQKQFSQSRAKEFEEKKKKQIEEFKKQRDNVGTSNLYEREALEEQQRLNKLKENRPVNESDDPNLKGFDAELAKKMADNIDPSWEFNACKWIEQLSGETVYDAGECLYTGIVLCKLINAIKPNTIAKFYSKPIALMQTENIKLYLIACQQLGVAKDDLFSVSDLHNRKNMKAVISNIYALARIVQSQTEWKGPTLLNAGAAPKNPSPRPSTKSVAIPSTQGRDRSKTEDLTPGFQSSAPEFRERSRTAGAKLSSNVSDLQHEVVTLRDELETLRRQLAEKDKVIKVLKPPKWRPDEDVERCTLCAMEFTFWNRRHHCRQCGEIFCGECCSKSIEIPQLNKQMQKVCNRCHIDLQQFQSNMGPTLDSWNVY